MAVSEATLQLTYRARNLAADATKQLAGQVAGIADTATRTASRVAGAFAGMGSRVANSIGMVTETLASGGSLTQGLTAAGVFMAGQLAESFGEQAIEKFGSSALLATVTAPLTALGTAAGGLISAAIPIGMAALPFLIVGAIIAVIAVLIANPDIRNKVIAFVGGLVDTLLKALSSALAVLPEVLGGLFSAAWSFIVDGVVPFIAQLVELWLTLPLRLASLGLDILHTIIDGLAGLPGAVADVIGNAFRSLKLDIGPFHISGGGVTIDLPKIDVPHFAGGVTGFRGGLALVGERGPELVRLPHGSDVIPNHRLAAQRAGSAQGVYLEGVTEAELDRIIDRAILVRVRRAGTGR